MLTYIKQSKHNFDGKIQDLLRKILILWIRRKNSCFGWRTQLPIHPAGGKKLPALDPDFSRNIRVRDPQPVGKQGWFSPRGGYFPDGTFCHNDGTQDYYCRYKYLSHHL